MRVAINGRFILPRLEGIGQYSVEILGHLISMHPEDEFHVIVDRNIQPIFKNWPNVFFHQLSPPTRHPVLWYYWFEHRLPGLLEKINPDVFFSPDGFLSLRSHIPTLLTIS